MSRSEMTVQEQIITISTLGWLLQQPAWDTPISPSPYKPTFLTIRLGALRRVKMGDDCSSASDQEHACYRPGPTSGRAAAFVFLGLVRPLAGTCSSSLEIACRGARAISSSVC